MSNLQCGNELIQGDSFFNQRSNLRKFIVHAYELSPTSPMEMAHSIYLYTEIVYLNDSIR